jgi:hypothetical protein
MIFCERSRAALDRKKQMLRKYDFFLTLQKNGKKIRFILYLAKVIFIVAAARYTTDTSHNVLKATNLISSASISFDYGIHKPFRRRIEGIWHRPA